MLAHLQLRNLGNFSPFLVPHNGVSSEAAAQGRLEERQENQRTAPSALVDPLRTFTSSVVIPQHTGWVPCGLKHPASPVQRRVVIRSDVRCVQDPLISLLVNDCNFSAAVQLKQIDTAATLAVEILRVCLLVSVHEGCHRCAFDEHNGGECPACMVQTHFIAPSEPAAPEEPGVMKERHSTPPQTRGKEFRIGDR